MEKMGPGLMELILKYQPQVSINQSNKSRNGEDGTGAHGTNPQVSTSGQH